MALQPDYFLVVPTAYFTAVSFYVVSGCAKLLGHERLC